MLLAAVEERLRAHPRTAAMDVHGAATLAAAEGEQRREGLFVFPVSERAEESEAIGRAVQRRATRVGVMLAATAQRDRRGRAGMDRTDAMAAAVQAALVGWQPSAEHSPMIYRSGDVVQFTRSTLWWGMEFETEDYLREEAD